MEHSGYYHIAVVGAGAAGLVIAIGAAKAGKKVVLIEKGHWGGDCTNFGCIPSKSLIASANVAHLVRNGELYGLTTGEIAFDGHGALERARAIVAEIRAHEEPEALQKWGIDAIEGMASFVDEGTLAIRRANGELSTVGADKVVLATGSYPSLPSIVGLDQIPYMTNETIFSLTKLPKRLLIIGGGPIGCELAQAFCRLGSSVALVHRRDLLLNKEEEEAQRVITGCLWSEGVELYLSATPLVAGEEKGELFLDIQRGHTIERLHGSHLLVATGRLPVVEGLNLEAMEIDYTDSGIITDDYGRTNCKNVWAVGDVTGRSLFTHVAENEARGLLRNLLLPRPFWAKLDKKQPVPRVTYTSPEVASVGLGSQEAILRYGKSKIAIYRLPMKQIDRAVCSGTPEGFIQLVTKKWSGRLLGVTIVAERAGEMLMEPSLAIYQGIPLRKIASLIHPYPTYSQAVRKAADRWMLETVLPLLRTFSSAK